MENLRELALFAGAGGGILGGHLLGWRTVCAVEIEPYPASVLVQRQNDGCLSPFPIWDNVCTFDGLPWRGLVDVVSGGFPCQDISAAGTGAGITGERSGLWKEMARIIREIRPRFAFVENSPRITSKGIGVILADLASIGYDAFWSMFSASEVGTNQRRKRFFLLAYPNGTGLQIRESIRKNNGEKQPSFIRGYWWTIEPGMVRVVHGFPSRVDRVKALGNSQLPQVAELAWNTLYARI